MRTQSRRVGRAIGAVAVVATTLALGAGCSGGPSPEELATVDYTPVADAGWPVSTPSDAGLDPNAVAELYYDAAELETIYGLLVVKDGSLIAEDYFNGGGIDQKTLVQSVAKSFTSALVGIAVDQGCLPGIDERMVDYFPEDADRMDDPRKNEITVEEMLQLRAGYPPEESDEALWEAVWSGDYVHLVADVPLSADPGTEFQYSNLTAHWLGIIVARACDTDLEALAQDRLLGPMGGEVGAWRKDVDGYNWAAGELHVTARDAAKFGMLYLDEGEYDGTRLISADWVRDSLQTYSEGAYDNIGDFRDLGYGYLWWSARIGDHDVNFAWGHGGQLIVLVHDLDMAVVVTADPFYETFGSESWRHEKANFELVGEFIAGLP